MAAKKLPKQVQDQIDETNRLAAEIYKDETPENQDENQGEGESIASAGSESEGPDNAAQLGASADLSFEAEGGTPAQTTEGQSDQSGEVTQEDDALTHKYKTLQGMYNSEKRRNDELTGRIEGLEALLAKMQDLRKQPVEEKQAAAQDKAAESLLTQEEMDDYGSDLIDVMKRAAREAVKGELEELREQNRMLKSVVGGVGQRQEVSEQEKFYARLESKVDNWKDLNSDPDFLNWLAQQDVYAGEPRKALLTRAFRANDADRVARFFIGYLEEHAALKATPTTQPTPALGAGGGKVDLASLAAPGTGASGSADRTNQNAVRQWKESEIGAFYDAATKGRYKGRADEYARIELQINEAMKAGRILIGQ